jgi:signal transduction histidine kinase
MVESLLYLFRLEAGQVEARTDDVDLREIVHDSWAHLKEAAEARKLQTHCELPSPVMVSTDGGLLSLAIRNILENAVLHSDRCGVVRVGVRSANGRVAFDVSNTCSQGVYENVPMLFERFWRGDESRSSSGVHSGLGLSVVKKVADVLGCALGVESNDGEFRITLSLKSSSLTPAET